jgi:hypothetical protein
LSMNDVIIVLVVFIQAEQEVVVRLLYVRYRLKWKSQRIYNTYGYNTSKCWKRHPQACDRGHLCHRNRSMCVGLSYFQYSAAPYLHRALGNFGALWIK